MKKIYFYALPALALAMASCADSYEGDFKIDKPASVEVAERLASYGVLGDYTAASGIKLGVSVDPDVYAAQELAYSIVKTNFSQVESGVAITPLALKNEDNVFDFSPLSNLVETAVKGGVDVFGPALCSDVNLPASYLKSLIADVVIPYQPWNEEILEADFENDAIGTQYASQKKAVGKVAVAVMEDPLGQQGKVLGGTKLTMDVPMVEITLPEGFTLKDVSRVTLKCLLLEGTPTAARIQIEGSGNNDKDNPYSSKGKWEEYIYDLTKIKFKESELAKNKFTLAAGAYGSNVSCCIDDITIRLEHKTGDDTVIVKTPEEKTEIIGGELYKWVDGIAEICAPSVKDYIIFDQPLASAGANFDWSEYLGDKYIADVQKAVDAKVEGGARYFVSQNLSLNDDFASNVAALKAEVQTLQGNGVKVDGINVVLDAACSLDASSKVAADAAAVAAIKSLASLGKPVRIGGLKIKVVDGNGAQLNAANLSDSQRQEVARYYELFIKTFITELGSNAQGISFSSIFDTAEVAAPWLGNGNRSFIYEGIVKGLSK